MLLAMSGILITGTHSISDSRNLRKLTEMSSKIAAIKIHRRLVWYRGGFFPPEASAGWEQPGKSCCKRNTETTAVRSSRSTAHPVLLLDLLGKVDEFTSGLAVRHQPSCWPTVTQWLGFYYCTLITVCSEKESLSIPNFHTCWINWWGNASLTWKLPGFSLNSGTRSQCSWLLLVFLGCDLGAA